MNCRHLFLWPTLALLSCGSTVAKPMRPADNTETNSTELTNSLCGPDEIAEVFYYASQIEFNTADSCTTEQIKGIQHTVVAALDEVDSDVREELSKDRGFIATHTRREQMECPEPVVSKNDGRGNHKNKNSNNKESSEDWESDDESEDEKENGAELRSAGDSKNDDTSSSVQDEVQVKKDEEKETKKDESGSSEESRSDKQNKQNKNKNKNEWRDPDSSDDSRRELLNFEIETVLGFKIVSLQVDLLGGGSFLLCYPSKIFEPKDRGGKKLKKKMADLAKDIREEERNQEAEWKEFERREKVHATRMDDEKAELDKLIETEIKGFTIEQEKLNATHRSQLVALEAKHSFNVPSTEMEELKAIQEQERTDLAKKQQNRSDTHEAWMVELEESQWTKKQMLAEERKNLETTRQLKRMEWDYARAKIEARLAQDKFLEKPENRKQKQFDTTNEDFLSFQVQFQKKLSDTLSKNLWEEHKKPVQDNQESCFRKIPEVKVSINRIPSTPVSEVVCKK